MMAKLVVGPVFELSSYFRIEFHSIVSYRERERERERDKKPAHIQ